MSYLLFWLVIIIALFQLSSHSREGPPVWQLSSLTKVLKLESEQKPNPVIQRVKLIMSAGLMLVHTLSRWPTVTVNHSSIKRDLNSQGFPTHDTFGKSHCEPTYLELVFRKLFTFGSEQLVMLGFVFALAIKYIFFENRDSYAEHFLAVTSLSEEENSKESKGRSCSETPSIKVTCQDSDTDRVIVENAISKLGRPSTLQNKTNAGIEESVVERKAPIATFFLGDDCSGYGIEVEVADREVQTDDVKIISCINEVYSLKQNTEPRDMETLVTLLNSEDGPAQLTDTEILILVEKKCIPAYKLESILGDAERGVAIRRQMIARAASKRHALDNIPYTDYDYSLVLGACCENVIGYMPLPLGIAGPLLLDGQKYYVPMATTEGCLVASTNRGCRALSFCNGVQSSVVADGMTRGPVIHFPSALRAAEAMRWLQEEENFKVIKSAFDSTSRFARLLRIHPRVAGRYLFVRFVATTGDAMGMNMLSKGTEVALLKFQHYFPDIELSCLSGNFCTDKKPAAVNWLEGRGKSVVCEARVSGKVIEEVLKTSVRSLVELNTSKNLIGSAMAGSIGGFNAQASNIVTAIFIATGQVSRK